MLDEISADTPKKKSLKRQVNKQAQKIWRMKRKVGKLSNKQPAKKQLIDDLGHYLTGPALEFVKTQVMLSGRRARGLRWKLKVKSLALSLYHASLKCYRLLRKLFLFPSKSTLCRALRLFKIYPGFPQHLLDLFKKKISNMSSLDKFCSIVFDEMYL